MVTALTAKIDELRLTQLLNKKEKHKQCKSKASGGGTDDGKSTLHHHKLDRHPNKCYGCGEEGHMVRNCAQKKKKNSIDEMKGRNQGKNE